MDKVKLTREQAEAIEELLKLRTKERIVREKANPFALISGYIKDSSRLVFKDMAFDTLIKALYIGYEVEETFDVGDWIATKGTGKIGMVKEIVTDSGDGWLNHDINSFGDAFYAFRHATPEEIAEEKQRRWWAKHGREVNEVKRGDIIRHKLDDELDEVIKLRELPENFIIVCFAENRLDL